MIYPNITIILQNKLIQFNLLYEHNNISIIFIDENKKKILKIILLKYFRK